jgi:hypothetical protein
MEFWINGCGGRRRGEGIITLSSQIYINVASDGVVSLRLPLLQTMKAPSTLLVGQRERI